MALYLAPAILRECHRLVLSAGLCMSLCVCVCVYALQEFRNPGEGDLQVHIKADICVCEEQRAKMWIWCWKLIGPVQACRRPATSFWSDQAWLSMCTFPTFSEPRRIFHLRNISRHNSTQNLSLSLSMYIYIFLPYNVMYKMHIYINMWVHTHSGLQCFFSGFFFFLPY